MARGTQKSYSFGQVPRANIPRSSFDRSSGYKTTFDAGYLIPFFLDEVYPGDTFNLRTSGFARLATPIFPVMDDLYMDTHYFFCPWRLVWKNFEKFMGEQENPGDSTDYQVPHVAVTAVTENSLGDYMGIPVGKPCEPSALFSRSIHLIWDEWFRDQNLQNSITSTYDYTGDGPDNGDLLGFVPTRGKRHDYFTSALPWPQKGPAVELPLGTSAPVVGNGAPRFSVATGGNDAPMYVDNSDDNVGWTGSLPSSQQNMNWATTNLSTDLTAATAATINDIRYAFQVQKMYERDARGGTRYREILQSHFGVTSPDQRLQRPEFLGGGSTPVNINPVQGTADTTTAAGEDGRPLGSQGAFGTASFVGHGFTKSFVEHGCVVGFVSVRANLTYQQGLNRMFSRRDRLDFYFPALAHLGEQEILNQEIYLQGDGLSGVDGQVFGYQERFAEMRYRPSQVTAQFRSEAAQTLDAWHLAQDFDSLPGLDENFIRENPPVDRVIAVTDQPHFIADFWHNLKCARPMPLFGVPGNIDRF